MPEENPRRKRSYVSSIIAFIVVLAVGVGCYYAWKIFSRGIEPAPAPAPTQEIPQPVVDPISSYASSTMRIAFQYPNTFTLNDQYAYTGVSPTKPIGGIQLKIPARMTEGTNLSADSYIAIEQLPRANLCTGDIYLAANVRAANVTDGAAMYSVASSTEGAAGNRYEEIVYALASSTPCTAVRYFIHTTNLDAVGTTSSVREFDRAGLSADFDAIRRSLVMQ